MYFIVKRHLSVRTRDGHAEADDAEVCGLMRICAYAEAIRKTKSVCAIVGKKTRSKIEQNWGAGARAQKTVKILNKNSQKSIKNRPKNGPKMVIFFTTVMWKCAYSRIDAL